MTRDELNQLLKAFSTEGGKVERFARSRKSPRMSVSKLRKAKKEEFASQIERQLPESEVWFRKIYSPYQHKADLFNRPLGIYIPDVLNKRLRYVIEVDGSIHDQPFQQAIDVKKNAYYMRKGFKVFRVKAYDDLDFCRVINELIEWRYQKQIKRNNK